MTRLLAWHRESIVKRALDYAFSEREALLDVSMTAMAERIASRREKRARFGSTKRLSPLILWGLLEDIEAVAKEKEAAKRDLIKLLESFTSLAKLKAGWPNGAPFYAFLDAPIASSTSKLPANLLAELDARLKLPIEKAA